MSRTGEWVIREQSARALASPCDCHPSRPATPPSGGGGLGPDDNCPRTLAEIVDHEAEGYRAWHTPEGDFLARQIDRLSQLIRWTGATTGLEHDDRMEAWDREIRDTWERRGYDLGFLDGSRHATGEDPR